MVFCDLKRERQPMPPDVEQRLTAGNLPEADETNDYGITEQMLTHANGIRGKR